jgi:hypothetical protein
LDAATAKLHEYLSGLSQSIDFDGIVVDQTGSPVPEAAVHLYWGQATQEASSWTNLLTDSIGSFALHGVEGITLTVRVTKDGFYSGRESWDTFRFGKETPSASAPASGGIRRTFRLYRKGPGVDLVSSGTGVKPYLGVPMPLEGAAVSVDLLGRNVGQTGQLTLQQRKPDPDQWKQATEWLFRISIPDGGFVEENEEFPFEAPQSGYRPVVEFIIQKGQPDWATDLSKDYYIRFGTPPLYGHLHLDTSIDMSGARLTYQVNPTGSRNLEPK